MPKWRVENIIKALWVNKCENATQVLEKIFPTEMTTFPDFMRCRP